MSGPDLGHIDSWVFDLDNTLYPSHCDLFAQIDVKMTDFVSRTLSLPHHEAKALQKRYYTEHGTTLSGLMKVNGLHPSSFLDYVHDIDLAPLNGLPDLSTALATLPGKRYVFTNGSRRHAENVTKKLKIDHLFDDMFDIHAANYLPKPSEESFDRFFTATGATPETSAMFEDLARNLVPAHQRGMTTILVRSARDWGPVADEHPGHPPHVHHIADDLAQFLGTLSFMPRTRP
ncbi:MAG: pyrimidine 5'-nucleotidase [Hyphomonadaceae bacterium]|nr:pyrimidine 5'-nucleotidase [Hyphomonadaceae bacterium]